LTSSTLHLFVSAGPRGRTGFLMVICLDEGLILFMRV